MPRKVIYTDSAAMTATIFGTFDINLQKIEQKFEVRIYNNSLEHTDGDAVIIEGPNDDNVEKAYKAMEFLKNMCAGGDHLSAQTVDYIIGMVSDGSEDELADFDDSCICITSSGKPIKAKTVGQKKYINAIKKNTIVLGVGPAGTGKTFLAVAMAVKALRAKEVNRIVLTRPAVEAGESLGFLPGDLQSKIDPYLRPLYDALFEMLGAENYNRHLEKGTIEIAPLAYMRGRTLDDSFIILDEAQNTTPEQMKMFLTRLGFNSKAIVTGDLTQTDLPGGKKSGLAAAVKILDGINGIGIHHFTERDVVRHRLVQEIILAYEKYEKEARKLSVQKTFKK
ncbi:MAG: phosphate starvation-inducible protein PhoH [Ruminococcaceae bacterium]|nr:phosphate starvation-inducible protein PhoH [Oscillospiraceae bacterium]